MHKSSNTLNLHDEYNLQRELVKLRKVFINVFTFELFYMKNLKLKNSYVKIIKHENRTKNCFNELKKKGKKINSKFRKEHCVKQNNRHGTFELNKNVCFIEKEILNRSFFNINIKNSNYDIKEKYLYLYDLFRRFCSIIRKRRKNAHNEETFFFDAFFIKKFCAFLNSLVLDSKKNVYIYSVRRNIQKCVCVNEKCERVGEKKKKIYICPKDGGIMMSILFTSCNFSIDRKRSKQCSTPFKCNNSKYNMLKVDVIRVNYIIKKLIYNDFYFNIFNSIYYSIINKNTMIMTDSLCSSSTFCSCENMKKAEDMNTENHRSNGKEVLNDEHYIYYFFICIKILFNSFNNFPKYKEKKKLISDNFFLFKKLKTLLKENVQNVLYITVVNIERIYTQLSLRYIFNLFLFYFAFLDINFYVCVSLVSKQCSLTPEERQFCRFFKKGKELRNPFRSKYDCFGVPNDVSVGVLSGDSISVDGLSGNNISLDGLSGNNISLDGLSGNNIIVNGLSGNNIIVGGGSEKWETTPCTVSSPNNVLISHIMCFFCSYDLLKKENLNAREKKKYFIFVILYILYHNYISVIKKEEKEERRESFLSYYFEKYMKKKIFFKKYNFSYSKFGKKAKSGVHHEHCRSCYFSKCQKKIQNNFARCFKKMNNKCVYIKHFDSILKTEKTRKPDCIAHTASMSHIEEHLNSSGAISNGNSQISKIAVRVYKRNEEKKVLKESQLSDDLRLISYEENVNISTCNYCSNSICSGCISNPRVVYGGGINNSYYKRITCKGKKLYWGNYSYSKFYELNWAKIIDVDEKVMELTSIVDEKWAHNNNDNNSYDYINEKIKIFLENLKTFLFPLLKKVYNTSVVYINVYIYLFMVHSFHLLEKKKKVEHNEELKREKILINKGTYLFLNQLSNNFCKKKQHICWEKKDLTCSGNFITKLTLYIYCKLLGFLHSSNKKRVILSTGENKKKKFYLNSNIYNFKIWPIRLLCKLLNSVDVYAYAYKESKGEKCFPLIGDKEISCVRSTCNKCLSCTSCNAFSCCIYCDNCMEGLFTRFYSLYIKKGENLSIQNRKNILKRKRLQRYICKLSSKNTTAKRKTKAGSDNLIGKYITLLYSNVNALFPSIYVYVNEEDFYVQMKKNFIIFNLRMGGRTGCESVNGSGRHNVNLGNVNHAGLQKYCSFFSDIDIFFGSSGDFFKLHLRSGAYEVNPPFDISLINKLIIYILCNLKKEEQELTFFLIIPFLKDKNYFYELLFSSPYVISCFLLKRNFYTFSTRLFESREEEYISTCDCFVFILQNEKAKFQKRISKKTVLKIKRLWENLRHI
ncbi:phosphorylated CTD interacting factor 1 WW domain-containing protein [Plasmodium brasilianum]|uniref:Phosphorylated CTD interacting factor 1 WW domain-containing protein n=1 Tax=Plasmodium brasilianum TaxID=5824 RepID=A0ACB9YEN5_PLABR|nr:phosphorylated CTD interacting factor 1 WW domain-containing protein [Plasmodium brasilianum]